MPCRLTTAQSPTRSRLFVAYLKSATTAGPGRAQGLPAAPLNSRSPTPPSMAGRCMPSVMPMAAISAKRRRVGHQLVYQPTIAGDTDLNGSVNFLDLTHAAQNLGANSGDWAKG